MATPEVHTLLDDYIRRNQGKIFLSYDILQDCSTRRYATADPITRMFIIGNPGAGKSSLIANLKKEGFFESLRRVTEESVPPHTAGIIPSIHRSKHYGRVVFYDFAGDPEYYSSHAAILENLHSSKRGSNVFVVVADLRKGPASVKNELSYWVSFIWHQNLERSPYLIIVGSHLDKISENMIRESMQELWTFCGSIRPGIFLQIKYFLVDCCEPKSPKISDIQSHLMDITQNATHCELGLGTSLLLGLLEKDFSNITACSVNTILSHIKAIQILLPDNFDSLLPLFQSLHEYGLVFIAGNRS